MKHSSVAGISPLKTGTQIEYQEAISPCCPFLLHRLGPSPAALLIDSSDRASPASNELCGAKPLASANASLHPTSYIGSPGLQRIAPNFNRWRNLPSASAVANANTVYTEGMPGAKVKWAECAAARRALGPDQAIDDIVDIQHIAHLIARGEVRRQVMGQTGRDRRD
jgi:hypothetical protein